jgi:ABC-2 type transport system permease protein
MSRKEFRQLARDRLTLGFVIGIPSLQLILFGYAINLDVRGVPTAVLDRAANAESRRFVGQLEATQTFDVVYDIATELEGARLLESSEVGAVVIIPSDFEEHVYRGRGAEVSILTDASNPTVASAVATAGRGLEQARRERIRAARGFEGSSAVPHEASGDPAGRGASGDFVHAEPLRISIVPLYNPERRTAVFIVPGLVGVILTMTMMMMTALALVRERGSFEFLISTPVRRLEVMLGKIVPYLVVGHVQVAVVLLLGALLFDVPLHGSLVDLGIGALPFLTAMLSMGLLISSLAQTQFQATQMSFFFFLPSMLLSGFMFPFEAMPAPARILGEILPLTHFLRIVRGILLKGASIEVFWSDLLAIVAFLFVTLTISVVTFRKTL